MLMKCAKIRVKIHSLQSCNVRNYCTLSVSCVHKISNRTLGMVQLKKKARSI